MYLPHQNELVKGIFLLILAISGNFVAETLGCKTQKLLSENMYAKHAIIILILYFAIGFTSSDDMMHPFEVGKLTLSIYFLFLLFARMDMTFTIITFILLAVTYVLSTFGTYYKSATPKETEKIKMVETVQNGLLMTIIGTILVGFVIYYKKKYDEYHKTWSFFNFIFGVNKCKSLN